jgi:phage head maturation protease
MEKCFKVYSADDDLQVDEGKREVVSIINTGAIDRDHEVVQPKGMKKKDFQGNPVVWKNHNYLADPNAMPVGVSRWIKSSTNASGEDVVIAKTYFTDKTQDGLDTFNLIQDGVLKAFSIGYSELRASKPSTAEINVRPELKNCKKIVREWNLLEYSVVGIASNPEALALAISKGYKGRIIDILKSAEEENITKDIVEEVLEEIVVKENKISEKEITRLVGIKLEQVANLINADAIIKNTLKQISKHS